MDGQELDLENYNARVEFSNRRECWSFLSALKEDGSMAFLIVCPCSLQVEKIVSVWAWYITEEKKTSEKFS